MSNQIVFSLKLEGDAKVVKAYGKDYALVLFKRNLAVIENGKKEKEIALKFDATSLEIGNKGIFIGDSVKK